MDAIILLTLPPVWTTSQNVKYRNKLPLNYKDICKIKWTLQTFSLLRLNLTFIVHLSAIWIKYLSVKNGYLYACHVDSNRFACYGVLVSKENKLISTYNYCVFFFFSFLWYSTYHCVSFFVIVWALAIFINGWWSHKYKRHCCLCQEE